jgi:hypothetical protein
LPYPTTSSTLGRTILQVDEHFIFAVWTIQSSVTNKKSMSLTFINQPSDSTICPE